MADGQTVTGDIVAANENGLQLNLGGGKYERLPWMKFSQESLKKLAAMSKPPKIAEYVDPFIEIPLEERAKKTEVVIKDVERLDRPAKRGSLFGGLFGSSVGLICLLLIYAANVYAGYEISVVRAYPVALVCGISAIAPIVGPIIFLCVPTRIISAEEWKPGQPRPQTATEGEAAAEPAYVPGSGLQLASTEAPEAAAASQVPQTQLFERGKFTFNRRFFETKFAGFFGLVRRDAEKDMVLVFKSPRGEFIANRITRITANELHLEVRKGSSTQETSISFAEIQEIRLKHKDA